MSIVRIDRFAVPPAEDDAFLAEWDAAGGPGVLHRAIRHDAPVRYIALAASGGGEPYELLREVGEPDVAGGVILIARWPEPSVDFVAAWDAQRVVLGARRGHIGARLYRGDGDYVEFAQWSSPLMLQRAEQDPEAVGLPGLVDAAIYQVVRR